MKKENICLKNVGNFCMLGMLSDEQYNNPNIEYFQLLLIVSIEGN